MCALEVDNEIEDTSDEEDTRERTLELDVEEPTKAISEDEITNEDEEVVDNKSNDEEDDEFLKELEQQEVKVKKVKNRKNYVEFDDFSDLKDDMLVTKILVRILVFIIIVVFIIACVLLANKYLGLGLF